MGFNFSNNSERSHNYNYSPCHSYIEYRVNFSYIQFITFHFLFQISFIFLFFLHYFVCMQKSKLASFMVYYHVLVLCCLVSYFEQVALGGTLLVAIMRIDPFLCLLCKLHKNLKKKKWRGGSRGTDYPMSLHRSDRYQ